MINKKTKKFFNDSGISLVEVLIYTFLFALLAGSIFSLVDWLISSNAKAKVMAATLDNANRAMEIMVSEIRGAKSIYNPAPPPVFLPNQLSLETTKYLPSGETTTYIDFYLCDQRLCFKKEGLDPVVITSDSVNISQLLFTEVTSGNASSVQIDLTAEYKNPSGKLQNQASVHLISTAALRGF